MRVSDCFAALRSPALHYTYAHATSAVSVIEKTKEKQSTKVIKTPCTPNTLEYETYWRDAYEERAAILEYSAGLPRTEAEDTARKMIHQLQKEE